MPNRYRTVLLFGAPGVGKGTQGKILGLVPGFYHLSCGDVFRNLDVNSPLGKIFMKYSSQGKLVPDEPTIEMWHTNMHARTILGIYKPHVDLLVLDGIPRNANQARLLQKHLEVLKIIHLTCHDEEKMFLRLRRRALKENRIDDAKEDVIRRRWEVYRAETQPVLDFYPQHLIAEVEAVGSPAEVLQHVLEHVVPVQNSHFTNALGEEAAQANAKAANRNGTAHKAKARAKVARR